MYVSKLYLLGQSERETLEKLGIDASEIYRSERVKRGTDFRLAVGIEPAKKSEIYCYLIDSENNLYRIGKMSKKVGKKEYMTFIIMPEDCRACNEILTFIEGAGVCMTCKTVKDLV